MLSALGLICFIIGALAVLMGSLDISDNDERGVFSVIVGFIIIGIATGVLYSNYIRINNLPNYTKVVHYEYRDVMYDCKPTPFTDIDQCTAIKERLTKSCTIINDTVWTDLNTD